ncbi:MAG: DUF3885 domain-containing protein [Acidobacteria bacterium]|nr:DUF3885 domain-containing protein [Acidobacteriota bacterium]
MSIRKQIEQIFGGKAFNRPLFYSFPLGLRFDFVKGDEFLGKFLFSLEKGLEICRTIFEPSEVLVLCIRFQGRKNLTSHISTIRSLNKLGLWRGFQKEHWLETQKDPEGINHCFHQIAFRLPVALVHIPLWCAFSADLAISPRADVEIRLFDLQRQILVFPYDDRGMDVISWDRDFLIRLWDRFPQDISEYDRRRIQKALGRNA